MIHLPLLMVVLTSLLIDEMKSNIHIKLLKDLIFSNFFYFFVQNLEFKYKHDYSCKIQHIQNHILYLIDHLRPFVFIQRIF